MKTLMCLVSRRELLRSITLRYQAASRKDEQRFWMSSSRTPAITANMQ
jgi:hypothetical protein